MPNYIIQFDIGCGPEYEEVEAENETEALKEAYKIWKEHAEENADYEVIGEATEELREDYLGS